MFLCRNRKWCISVRYRAVMENDPWRSWKIFYGTRVGTL